MRFVFVNRFFRPDHTATAQLLTDLAEALASTNLEVEVITSRGSVGVPERETSGGAHVRRVSTRVGGAASLARKAMDFATFSVAALWTLFRTVRKTDTVVLLTDPPLLGIPATLIARAKGARVVHWIHDIYPDVAMAVTGHRWISVLAPPRNVAWRRASQCVTISDEMAAVVNAAGVAQSRVTVIPNWAPDGLTALDAEDPAVKSLRKEWGGEGRLLIQYSGNLGRVHDLRPVLAAADLLREDADIAFVIVGDGAQRAALQAEAERRKLPNVRFAPPQQRSRLAVTLSAADLHLITLRPGCEPSVYPSKFYGIVAARRPMIFVGPTECGLARLITAEQLGCSVPANDPGAFADAIRSVRRDRTILDCWAEAVGRYDNANPSRDSIRRWQELLRRVSRS